LRGVSRGNLLYFAFRQILHPIHKPHRDLHALKIRKIPVKPLFGKPVPLKQPLRLFQHVVLLSKKITL